MHETTKAKKGAKPLRDENIDFWSGGGIYNLRPVRMGNSGLSEEQPCFFRTSQFIDNGRGLR